MDTPALESLPIAVIGGGPVGLAAAAHLFARGLPVKVYEAGLCRSAQTSAIGVMSASSRLGAIASTSLRLRSSNVMVGDCLRPTNVPTGAELVSAYLEPLAATPELAAVIETNARVTAISRQGVDKVVSHGRETRPFVLAVASKNGVRRDLARAIIDASGTWTTPNPLGASGLPALGEAEFADRIAYGIPDILGRDRHVYAGRKTLVVGSGHSAANALLELAQLAETEPRTSFLWATRSADLARIYQRRGCRPIAGARRTRRGCSGACR